MSKHARNRQNNSLQSAENMALIDHFEKAVEFAKKSGLNHQFFEKAKPHLEYAANILKITPREAALFALLLNSSDDSCITTQALSNAIKCNNLQFIKFMDEFESLEKRKLIRCKRRPSCAPSYRVPPDVLQAIGKNKEYVCEQFTHQNARTLFRAIHQSIEILRDAETSYDSCKDELIDLLDNNKHLSCVRKIKALELSEDDTFLLLIFFDLFIQNDDDYIGFHDFEDLYEIRNSKVFDVCGTVLYELQEEKNDLQLKGLIENACEDGLASPNRFKLTNHAKEEFLSDVTNTVNKHGKNYIIANKIKEKKLYYNDKESHQVCELTTLLQKENFAEVQKRLKDNGMRGGFACLFYGPPGTGKTETVYQIARLTGRDICNVDISQIVDKYVGESEKNIKRVFERYRDAVKNCKDSSNGLVPILLFNEADAIINKRSTGNDNNASVQKMYNTMQNIILQEIENLDGILIATTNLTENLDTAFERRFLYKIEFQKPSAKTRAAIWKSIIPNLSEADADELSTQYDFSGGQIENIARKRAVDNVISGNTASLSKMMSYCNEERLGKSTGKPIGFNQ